MKRCNAFWCGLPKSILCGSGNEGKGEGIVNMKYIKPFVGNYIKNQVGHAVAFMAWPFCVQIRGVIPVVRGWTQSMLDDPSVAFQREKRSSSGKEMNPVPAKGQFCCHIQGYSSAAAATAMAHDPDSHYLSPLISNMFRFIPVHIAS